MKRLGLRNYSRLRKRELIEKLNNASNISGRGGLNYILKLSGLLVPIFSLFPPEI